MLISSETRQYISLQTNPWLTMPLHNASHFASLIHPSPWSVLLFCLPSFIQFFALHFSCFYLIRLFVFPLTAVMLNNWWDVELVGFLPLWTCLLVEVCVAFAFCYHAVSVCADASINMCVANQVWRCITTRLLNQRALSLNNCYISTRKI